MAKTKFFKELSAWTTPAFTERKIFKTLGKTLYRAGRFAVRRPLLTSVGTYVLGKGYRGHKKYLKRKVAGSAYSGRMIMKEGKILF